MLDLTAVKKYYEIKWFDGVVYHLNLPSQELLIRIVSLEKIEDVAEQIEGLSSVIKDILNTNKEGKTFTEEDFALLDLQTIQLIMEDYMDCVGNQLGE